MTKQEMKLIQDEMRSLGFYRGEIDGIWGKGSQDAFVLLTDHYRKSKEAELGYNAKDIVTSAKQHIWGKKVGKDFVAAVTWIANAISLPDPDGEGTNNLLACMAFESGETFSPSIKNGAGSGATGLIQFMPSTARSLGTTTDKLAKMTQLQQLNYVYKYFAPHKGKLKNLGDIYMAILWPAGIGKADTWVLWDSKSRPTVYRQNSGLDVNKDGVITRGEALKKIREKYEAGKKYMG